MKTAESRKIESIATLQRFDVPFIEWLPTIETANSVYIRSAEEVAQRSIACLIAIQAACDRNNDSYTPETAQWCLEMIQQYELGNVLSANEVEILNNQGDAQDVVNMIWKYEAYWSLLWALGLVDSLDFPNDTIDCNFAINVIASCESFDAVMQKVNLRDIEEILDQADLIYRYHWACVNARINQLTMPANMIESVVSERRAGLDWIIQQDAEWDNPELST